MAKMEETDAYKVTEDPNRPKFYVLDMFPSSGLTTSDTRFGYTLPMSSRVTSDTRIQRPAPDGVRQLWSPAEQYAIQTGNIGSHHRTNISRYRNNWSNSGSATIGPEAHQQSAYYR